MSELVDQSGYYLINQGTLKGKFCAMIYDLDTMKYIAFNDKGTPITVFGRNEIVRSVNLGEISLIKETNDTIQSMIARQKQENKDSLLD